MPSGIYKRTEEHRKKISGKNHWNYKDGRSLRKHYCIDCGKELSNYTAKRCRKCATKEVANRSEVKEKQRKRMTGKNHPRYIDGRTLKKYYCIDCGKELSWYTTKRCQSCASKQAWQVGKMDGIFKSPNKPEKEIMKMLEDSKFDYTFQYRIPEYSKPYDFYIPRLNLLVEYDGEYWHNLPGRKENDKEKTQWATDNCYNLLRLNKYNLKILKMILKEFYYKK